MPHRIAIFALTSLALAGCHIEHLGNGDENIGGDEAPCDADGGAHTPTGAGGTQSSSDGGDAATPIGCSSDADCDADSVCDVPSASCVPAPEPTCSDLESEAECSERSECTPVYAGVDCSCGPDCTCVGGEPGCICEAFQFFACAEAGAR